MVDGLLFDLNQSNVYRDIQKIERLVIQCIYLSLKIYTTLQKDSEQLMKLRHIFLGFIFLDSSEQKRIPRPLVDNGIRKMYYSLGKKKIYTAVKTQFVVNNRGYILHKVAHKKGRRYDDMLNI